jgi:hypothetical protein
MQLNEVVAKINAVDSGLAEVKLDVMNFIRANSPALAAVPAPVKVVVADTPTYHISANGMLMEARAYGSASVDPVVGADCPYTVVVPRTGHVLSVPRVDLHEGFIGYVMRVADQSTGGKGDQYLGTVGSLFLGTEHLFKEFGGFDPSGANWPNAADKFYNMRAYMTADEKAADDRAQQGWRDWDAIIQKRIENEYAGVPPEGASSVPGGDTPPGETPL